ncbi:hypothetical protein [Thermomonospora curvata]|uniref:hypothetical protein n=1 Tax=Thermomonospora curvata TaxID=2020 RepID=UPI00145F40CC|nr:hypothetical protein [Thermomonospora curvata]
MVNHTPYMGCHEPTSHFCAIQQLISLARDPLASNSSLYEGIIIHQVAVFIWI